MVKEIYKLQRLALCLQAVQQARCSGNYHRLQDAIANLKQAKNAFLNIKADNSAETPDNDNNDSECTLSHQKLVNEDAVIEAFGKELKLVAVDRDTYTTTACSFCEQIKPGLKKLKSLENRKGFDSEKMTTAIEILYQNKTQHEDIDEFLEDVKICSYCSQKLLANKDVARSAFNSLSIVKTPDCIKNLNMFEKTLIKFCMTCITVLRLDQITNKKRPQNELTAALKGRIAYLPVDVEANASFVPDKLLNVNSRCVLVAGQPTKAHRVWTAMVDLKKVHVALLWLKENNRMYKDTPAYTVEDLQKIISSRLQDSDAGQPHTDAGLLKKLDDASKSYLYENFSIQPLSSDYPKDAVADYQINKITGDSISAYDNDLDLKAFPELYPTAENGMRAARDISLAPSDFIKSRLLNINSKFRLNINYLFHLFQQH